MKRKKISVGTEKRGLWPTVTVFEYDKKEKCGALVVGEHLVSFILEKGNLYFSGLNLVELTEPEFIALWRVAKEIHRDTFKT